MLFAGAGEVLPHLGRAMSPDTFAPLLQGALLELLLKKTGSTPTEQAVAVGILANCAEPLRGRLEPFLPALLPVFTRGLQDESNILRNNAVFGLGEVVMWGGAAMVPHYSGILQQLSKLLGMEQTPRVLDQIVGALARSVAFCTLLSKDLICNQQLVHIGIFSH